MGNLTAIFQIFSDRKAAFYDEIAMLLIIQGYYNYCHGGEERISQDLNEHASQGLVDRWTTIVFSHSVWLNQLEQVWITWEDQQQNSIFTEPYR